MLSESDLRREKEDPGDDREEDGGRGESERSAFALLSRVVLSLSRTIQDGVDLAGATLREELTGFRDELLGIGVSLVHRAAGTALLVLGAALVTGGVALLLHEWAGLRWSHVLLLVGGAYLGGGLWLALSRPGGRRR